MVRIWDPPGRDDWIRTSDPHVPNVVLYQAEPHPDQMDAFIIAKGKGIFNPSSRASLAYLTLYWANHWQFTPFSVK